jgi:hypothetical protein
MVAHQQRERLIGELTPGGEDRESVLALPMVVEVKMNTETVGYARARERADRRGVVAEDDVRVGDAGGARRTQRADQQRHAADRREELGAR